MIGRAIVLAGLVVATTGCPDHGAPEDDIILYGLTTPPPASEGTIVSSDDTGYTITMSRGVAIGARCWDSCDYECLAPAITVADEAVLASRPMWRPSGADSDRVLIAMAAGTTTLQVTTACATRRYDVRVVDQ